MPVIDFNRCENTLDPRGNYAYVENRKAPSLQYNYYTKQLSSWI